MRNKKLRIKRYQNPKLGISIKTYDPRIVVDNHTPFYFDGSRASEYDIFEIDWGDGSLPDSSNMIHIYENAGTYTIIVFVQSTSTGREGYLRKKIQVVEASYTPSNAYALDLVQKASYTNDVIREGIDDFFTAISSFISDIIEMKLYLTDRPSQAGALLHFKWNAVDPRDLDAAYRETYHGTGSPIANYSGIKYNGQNQYARTYLIANNIAAITNSNVGLTLYTGEEYSNGGNDYGARSSADGNSYLVIAIGFNNTSNFALFSGGTVGVSANDGNRHGLFTFARESSTTVNKTYKNAEAVVNQNTAALVKANRESYRGCSNFGSATNFTNQRHLFAMTWVNVDSTKVATLHTAINNLQELIENEFNLEAGTRKKY